MNDVGCKEQRQNTLEGSRIVAAEPVAMVESGSRHAESYFPSAIRPTLLMVVAVFLVEQVVEYSLAHFFSLSLSVHVFVDAGSTVLLLMPIFYFVLYRPFKNLDAERQRAQLENQLLSRKLIHRSEDEKQRLARDLHDDFGQILTALQFGVATLKESCLIPDSQVKGCAQRADKLTEMIAELGDQVRSLTLDLRPAVLDDLGLQSAIQILVDGDWGELEITFEEQGVSRRFAPEIELSIFRICQEALNNILKHAHATHAEICLTHSEATLCLRVSDNGRGFVVDDFKSSKDRRRGFGLLGLRERVASLGGDLQLISTPGQGTTIQVQVSSELQRRRDEADSDPDC